MRRIRGSKPSPAVIVAVVALVAAVTGIAVAAPATTSDLNRKQIKRIVTKKAKKIAKKKAKKFAPRVASASSDGDALVGPGEGTILETPIRARRDGFLAINAGSDVLGDDGAADCRIHVDGTRVDSSSRRWRVRVAGAALNDEEDCTTETTVPIRKGNHTVELVTRSIGPSAKYDAAELQVLWVPFEG